MSTTMTPPPAPPPAPQPARRRHRSEAVVQAGVLRRPGGQARRGHELLAPARRRSCAPACRSSTRSASSREENASKKMQEVLADMQRRLRAGSSFGDAIAAHTRRCSPATTSRSSAPRSSPVSSTTRSSSSPATSSARSRRGASSRARSRTRSSCSVLAIVAVIVMSMFVLPKFQTLLRRPRRQAAAADADAARLHQLHVGLVVGDPRSSSRRRRSSAFVAARREARQDPARHVAAPAARRSAPLVKLIAIERFCRVLGALVHTGVPLPDAVQVSADSTNNRVFQTQARDGARSDDARRRPRPTDPGLGHLPAGGAPDDPRRREHRLARHCSSSNAAVFYERELTFRLKRFTDMFEPAIILVVGGMVAFVAIAQISAMYSVYHQVKV